MKSQLLVQDYHGATYFIEKNKGKDLTIFIVDDNKVYLNLMKHSLARENFNVMTFTSGEECLNYLELNPDLIILDYHLNSVNPYAMNGDEVSKIIQKELPKTEMVIVSADKKFQFISDIHLSKRLIFKDHKFFNKVSKHADKVAIKSFKIKGSTARTTVRTVSLSIAIILPLLLIYQLL